MTYSLPKLSFAYNALEPFMDSKTIEIHYTKHHQTYADKLNAAIEKHPELSKKQAEELLLDLNKIPEDIRTAVRNFGGGFVNHNLFWSILASGKKISGDIAKAIDKEFGSYEAFKEKFSAPATSLFGSGWTWLVLDKKSKKLEIINTANQDSPISIGKVPLLVIDVWEHSFYLKWQWRKKDYIDNFWNIVDWEQVEKNYLNSIKKK